MRITSLLGSMSIAAVSAWSTEPAVKTGLDLLVSTDFSCLAGRKVIILTNPTGVTKDLDLGVDVMFQSGKVDLVGVMGPEHGFRGAAQAGSGAGGTFKDPSTGLTVYDAYNANTSTLVGFIKDSGADTVVFDIQDVGARFYTYTWAMYDTLVASTLCNTTFMILDRPNPITGLNAFGPILNESYASYVGRRPIAQAHGMTTGELANMFIGEGWIQDTANQYANLSITGSIGQPKLEIVKMEGWERWMDWRATGLYWVLPSPNMQSPTAATVYPGNCMFEGTSLSEGRGTVRPFELIGAPFTNSTWTKQLRSLNLPYTAFRDACFAPTTSKQVGLTCCGVQTYPTFLTGPDLSADNNPYATWDPVEVGVALLKTAHDLYPNLPGSNLTTQFTWLPWGGDNSKFDVDILAGGPLIREGINAGLSVETIKGQWALELEKWKQNVRVKYLTY